MALNLCGEGTVTISGETQETDDLVIGRPLGQVFMLAAGTEPELRAKKEMQIFVACCPPEYFRSPCPSPSPTWTIRKW
eukprot:g6553.t1